MSEEETLTSRIASQFLRNKLISLVGTVNHKWKLSIWVSYTSEELQRMSHWWKPDPGVQTPACIIPDCRVSTVMPILLGSLVRTTFWKLLTRLN